MKQYEEVTLYRVTPRKRPARIFRDPTVATIYAGRGPGDPAPIGVIDALRSDDGTYWTITQVGVESDLSADAETALRALDGLSPKERERVLTLASR